MTAAFLKRSRVILAFVTPCVVFAGMFLLALNDFAPTESLILAWVILSFVGGFVWLAPEYVALGRKRPLGVIASVLVPPLVLVALFVFHEYVLVTAGIDVSRTAVPWLMLIPLGTGLLILARVFGLYALPLAIVYLPGMWFLLFAIAYPLALGRRG